MAAARSSGSRPSGGDGHLRTLVIVTAVLALGSALWMGVAAHLLGPDRAYLGTDTRCGSCSWAASAPWRCSTPGPPRHPARWNAAHGDGALAGSRSASALGHGPARMDVGRGARGHRGLRPGRRRGIDPPPRGSGGASARASGRCDGSGRISYSLYLWHWPVIVLLTADEHGLVGSGPAELLGLAAMVGAALFSYVVVEQPLRRVNGIAGGAGSSSRPESSPSLGIVLVATVPPSRPRRQGVRWPRPPARRRARPSGHLPRRPGRDSPPTRCAPGSSATA